MKVFITGAGGFLGKYIIRRLQRIEKVTIYATSLYSSDLVEFFEEIVFVPNESVLEFNFSCIDIVINCAFPRAMNGTAYADGLDFLNNLFKKIQQHKECGIIDISSQSVYSFQRTKPADEDTQKDLSAVYDVAKYCMEMLVDARLSEHKVIHLRLASLIGPGFDQRIINRFILKVINCEDITVTGGKQLFGFLDVRDCADAIGTLVKQWDKIDIGCYVYNIGSEYSSSLLEIAETALRVGREFGYNNSKLIVVPSDERKNTSINANKFYLAFNWKPHYCIEDTARNIFESLKK